MSSGWYNLYMIKLSPEDINIEVYKGGLDLARTIITSEELLPPKLLEAIIRLPQEWIGLTDGEIKEKGYKPSITDRKLRTGFWRAVQAAEKTGSAMNLSSICRGVCGTGSLHGVMANPPRLAYMLAPIVSYEIETETMLNMALERYNEILEMPIHKFEDMEDESGEIVRTRTVDLKKAEMLLKVLVNVEDRVKGKAVSKNINVNENVRGSDDISDWNMSKIDEELAKINSKLTAYSGGNTADIMDADFKEVENEQGRETSSTNQEN